MLRKERHVMEVKLASPVCVAEWKGLYLVHTLNVNHTLKVDCCCYRQYHTLARGSR